MIQINKKGLNWGFRQILLLACCVSVATVFMISGKIGQKNYQFLYEQTEMLSRVVVRQAAKTAFEAIRFEDNQAIDRLIQDLVKEPFILDATIYDNQGNYLHGSENSLSVTELTGLNTPLSVASIGRRQVVEPITKDGKFSGFLRITLEHGQIIKAVSNKINTNINLIQSLLVMALVTGAVLILLLSKQIQLWLAPFLSSKVK